MSLTSIGGRAAALAGALVLCLSEAHASWTITTYSLPADQRPAPQITTMALADQYFTVGPKLQESTGTVTQVDLFQTGGVGQFTINNPFPGLTGDTEDFVARITGTLVFSTQRRLDFFTDSDDGNRFRLDLDRDGIFEDFGDLEGNPEESIVPDGGLQGAGSAERSNPFVIAPGNYPFEIQMYERGGGASIDAGYRLRTLGQPAGPQKVLGDTSDGISLLGGSALVKVVVADLTSGGFGLPSLAEADALRAGTNAPGFPASAGKETFNVFDTASDFNHTNGATPPLLDPGFANGYEAPGLTLGVDDDQFAVYGTGTLIVPTGGITGAIFKINSDDGGRLLIDVNDNGVLTDAEDVVAISDQLQGATPTLSLPITLAAGDYKIEYVFFEFGGGAHGEVSVDRTGTAVDATSPNFRLLGDDAAVAAGTSLDVIGGPATGQAGDLDGDLDVDGTDLLLAQRGTNIAGDIAAFKANFGAGGAVTGVPEPSSCLLAALAALGLLQVRRRRG